MDHVKKFVDYMNAKHSSIRFIFEKEDLNSFSFLDIKVIRDTGKKAFIETLVYRKRTFSGVFTNCKSFIPMTCYFSIYSSYESCQAQRDL